MSQPPDPCPTCGYPIAADNCEQCYGRIVVVDGFSDIQPGRRFFAIELIEGFTSLFQASLLLMTKKEYMGKLGLAVFINLVLVVVFGVGIWYGFYELVSYLLESFQVFETVRFALATVLAVLSTWLLAPTLISAGMTPFLEPIANATEKMLAGQKMRPVEMGMWRGLMAGLNAAAQILVVQIFVLVPVLLLALIPFVGPFFIVVGVLLSAYLNAVVWFEIPVLRRGYGMPYRRAIVRRNWARSLGFGIAFNLGLLIPFFNFLFIGPATAVAVSTLYLRFDKSV